MFRHLLDTIQCLVDLAVALETEGNGDDTYGQDAHLLRDARNDRRSTGTCTTTHTGCDKGHTGAVVQHFLDFIEALLSGSTCLFGLVAGTESLLAQL